MKVRGTHVSNTARHGAPGKTHVADGQNNIPIDRKSLSMAKAALRSAERELRDWQKGIVPPLAEPAIAMGAAAGQ